MSYLRVNQSDTVDFGYCYIGSYDVVCLFFVFGVYILTLIYTRSSLGLSNQ